MKSWQGKLIVPAWYREQEELGRVGSDGTLWPACWICSKKEGYNVAVTAYGIRDCGRKDGVDYTDVYARCHGQEDIVRIEGINWNKTCPKDGTPQEVLSNLNILRQSALKMIQFFYQGADDTRTIPLRVMRDLEAAVMATGQIHG